jgi:hypothetical protein
MDARKMAAIVPPAWAALACPFFRVWSRGGGRRRRQTLKQRDTRGNRVTARRREERLRDIPVAASAFGEAELRRRQPAGLACSVRCAKTRHLK